MGPRNRFQGMNSASLCSLAGRYDNPIPPWFLAHIDCLKIPALNPHYENGFKSVFLLIFKAQSYIADTLLKGKGKGEGTGFPNI
jgi:hypothetical protein